MQTAAEYDSWNFIFCIQCSPLQSNIDIKIFRLSITISLPTPRTLLIILWTPRFDHDLWKILISLKTNTSYFSTVYRKLSRLRLDHNSLPLTFIFKKNLKKPTPAPALWKFFNNFHTQYLKKMINCTTLRFSLQPLRHATFVWKSVNNIEEQVDQNLLFVTCFHSWRKTAL